MGIAEITGQSNHAVWGKGFGLCPSQYIGDTQKRAAFDLFYLQDNLSVIDTRKESTPYPRLFV